jgi:hypothetical protein
MCQIDQSSVGAEHDGNHIEPYRDVFHIEAVESYVASSRPDHALLFPSRHRRARIDHGGFRLRAHFDKDQHTVAESYQIDLTLGDVEVPLQDPEALFPEVACCRAFASQPQI